jgi:hypothetical protein
VKYITFIPPTGLPYAVLFSGHIKHDAIAEKIGQPVQGAGFVTIPDTAAFTGGYSTSLNVGVHRFDADLIRAGLFATEAAYPPPPAHITASQRLAAIEQAVRVSLASLRNGVNADLAHPVLVERIQKILSQPSA